MEKEKHNYRSWINKNYKNSGEVKRLSIPQMKAENLLGTHQILP